MNFISEQDKIRASEIISNYYGVKIDIDDFIDSNVDNYIEQKYGVTNYDRMVAHGIDEWRRENPITPEQAEYLARKQRISAGYQNSKMKEMEICRNNFNNIYGFVDMIEHNKSYIYNGNPANKPSTVGFNLKGETIMGLNRRFNYTSNIKNAGLPANRAINEGYQGYNNVYNAGDVINRIAKTNLMIKEENNNIVDNDTFQSSCYNSFIKNKSENVDYNNIYRKFIKSDNYDNQIVVNHKPNTNRIYDEVLKYVNSVKNPMDINSLNGFMYHLGNINLVDLNRVNINSLSNNIIDLVKSILNKNNRNNSSQDQNISNNDVFERVLKPSDKQIVESEYNHSVNSDYPENRYDNIDLNFLPKHYRTIEERENESNDPNKLAYVFPQDCLDDKQQLPVFEDLNGNQLPIYADKLNNKYVARNGKTCTIVENQDGFTFLKELNNLPVQFIDYYKGKQFPPQAGEQFAKLNREDEYKPKAPTNKTRIFVDCNGNEVPIYQDDNGNYVTLNGDYVPVIITRDGIAYRDIFGLSLMPNPKLDELAAETLNRFKDIQEKENIARSNYGNKIMQENFNILEREIFSDDNVNKIVSVINSTLNNEFTRNRIDINNQENISKLFNICLDNLNANNLISNNIRNTILEDRFIDMLYSIFNDYISRVTSNNNQPNINQLQLNKSQLDFITSTVVNYLTYAQQIGLNPYDNNEINKLMNYLISNNVISSNMYNYTLNIVHNIINQHLNNSIQNRLEIY